MTELVVRKIPFTFKDVHFFWNPDNPDFSIIGNVISFGAVGFERWLCRAFTKVLPLIKDDDIREECKLFMAQEAAHSAVHARHVNALINRYPELKSTQQKSIDYFSTLLDEKPLEFNICFGAALEATFTPTFKMIIDYRHSLMGGGDARVASALLWHFCEEIEHRSSALNIYHSVYKSRFGRLKILKWSRQYLSDFTRLMIRDFQKNIPKEEWINGSGRAFSKVPKLARRVAMWRIFLSQTPWHNPDNEPLPQWAEEWFSAYSAGKDMTQFFGAKVLT